MNTLKSYILYILLIIIVAFILMLFAPWWCVAIAGFTIAFFLIESPARSFYCGLIGVGILWIALTLYFDSGSSVSVAESLGNVVGGVPSYLMYIIAGLTGGAVGGLGAMTGTYARSILLKK